MTRKLAYGGRRGGVLTGVMRQQDATVALNPRGVVLARE